MPFENYSGEIIFLKEGDEILMGEDILEVFFTPGHSVGHVVFYNRKQGFLIGGDVLFRIGDWKNRYSGRRYGNTYE